MEEKKAKSFKLEKELRKDYIRDTIGFYIKKHPQEYQFFLDWMKQKRNQMTDKTYGVVDSDVINQAGQKYSSDAIRVTYILPEKLDGMLRYAFDEVHHKKFCHDKKESAWFCREFPQFLLSEKY